MSNIYEDAVRFALRAHEGQKRKGGGIYILHPLEVSVIAGTMTQDPEVLAAAVLHDTVEDTPVTADRILETFGERIARLVASETEDKRADMPPAESWMIRKEESLEELKNCGDEDVKIIWLADKLSNMRSLFRDYRIQGLAVFDKFNVKDPKLQRWYHSKVLEYTASLSDFPAYREYRQLFDIVFENV